MANSMKNMVIGSMGVAGLVAVLAIVDIATGLFFGGSVVLNATLIVGAGIAGWLGYDAYKDMK